MPDETISPEYAAEIRAAVERIQRMECVRTPELLRATAMLLDVWPELERRLEMERALPTINLAVI